MKCSQHTHTHTHTYTCTSAYFSARNDVLVRLWQFARTITRGKRKRRNIATHRYVLFFPSFLASFSLTQRDGTVVIANAARNYSERQGKGKWGKARDESEDEREEERGTRGRTAFANESEKQVEKIKNAPVIVPNSSLPISRARSVPMPLSASQVARGEPRDFNDDIVVVALFCLLDILAEQTGSSLVSSI